MSKLWSEFEISFQKWLRAMASLGSLSHIIKYLGLNHVSVTENPRLFQLVPKNKVIGFVCVSKNEIDLGKGKVESNCFLPVNVENADLSIGLLNILLGSFGRSGLGPILEEYSSDFDIHSYVNCFRPQIITPVAFAHNFTARQFPLDDEEQYVNFILAKGGINFLINRDGSKTELKKMEPEKMFSFLKSKHSDVYIVFEDVLKEKSDALELEKQVISELREAPANQSLYDPDMTFEDLSDMEKLAKELEMAEQFELSFSDGQKESKRHEESENETKIKKCEERILELQKAIAEIKMIVPITYSEVYDTKTLYTHKDYLEFLQFYKRTGVIKTPQILRHTGVGKSPMSMIRKRKRHASGSSVFSDLSNVSESTLECHHRALPSHVFPLVWYQRR
ncbi:unnamed protein product [Bursaphelenchus xylophilus]|uniref:(pine wood nematode) hypothetical protein n=1 Tax=Bursaphelenchus xylophilus TaxID=6326 RepID=A0A7I8XAL0_BURXY|nr:unnamed protein product [Bursaphelenchus xylophilus]CAG9082965.1 unnamed protein product [Bursaphelenchus xylophilus]